MEQKGASVNNWNQNSHENLDPDALHSIAINQTLPHTISLQF